MTDGIRWKRRRNAPQSGLESVGAVLAKGLLTRQIMPALDDAHRTELLGHSLGNERTLQALGIPVTNKFPAC